ncbi:MAG: hypothetical protein EOO45_21730 [Flavobacterium sp.]|nr:MAG: hypothetical protein EOO45_21730 [Flavobacterium sp.]
MKNITYTLFTIFAIVTSVFGQSVQQSPAPKLNRDQVSQKKPVSERPEFPGGYKALASYISNNLGLTESPTGEDIQVRCVITFVVDEEGGVTDIKVKGDPGYGIAKRIEEVLKKSPKWKPGKENGKAIKAAYTQPIVIQLLGGSEMTAEERGYYEASEVDVMPTYPKGEKALSDFISSEINRKILDPDTKGDFTIPIKFVVKADGSIGSLEIRSGHYGLDKEIARVLAEKVKYTPGSLKGIPVAVLTAATLSIVLSK